MFLESVPLQASRFVKATIRNDKRHFRMFDISL